MGKKLIRFDWAMKTLLRDKANFDVLEGFLGALLEDENIRVLKLLESESNQIEENDKFNRVDLLVEDGEKRKIIIEIQNTRESDYLERMLYGTSKVIVENIGLGEYFANISKVISVSILYFNLGEENDYLYYGTTEIRGVNTNKPLKVREKLDLLMGEKLNEILKEKNVFPKYYFINVEKYKNSINKNIDEWIYMFKNSEIKVDFKSKNIEKIAKKLEISNISEKERKHYERYLINVARERDIFKTARLEGKAEGKMEAKLEAKAERNIEIAQKLIQKGFSDEEIQEVTDLDLDVIQKLRVL